MKLIDGYYAKDQDGDVFWHEEMPVSRQYDWDSEELILELSCVQIDGPWEESLHKVENGKITKVQIYSKDQPVLASNDGENCYDRRWLKRYYSHYKDGNHYVFSNGRTSWSQEGQSVFKYIKPAEEE